MGLVLVLDGSMSAVYLPLVLIALGAGFLVFADQKGTADHKFWGRLYFLFAFAVSAVHIGDLGRITLTLGFWLPLTTIIALLTAFIAIRTARGEARKIRLHAYAMATSFALFLIQGVYTLLTALEAGQKIIVLVLALVLVASGVLIGLTVPGVLQAFRKDE